jgi:hypothetical protein
MTQVICKECKKQGLHGGKGLCFDCYCRLKQRRLTLNNPHYKEKAKQYHINHRTQANISSKKHYYQNKTKRLITVKDYKIYEKKNKCEKCGDKNNLEMHHLEYKEPLKIIIKGKNKYIVQSKILTLCIKCHKDLHKKRFNNIN